MRLIHVTLIILFLFAACEKGASESDANEPMLENDESSVDSAALIVGSVAIEGESESELVAGATIYLEGYPDVTATSDESGAYVLNIPSSAWDETALVALDSKKFSVYALKERGEKNFGIKKSGIELTKGDRHTVDALSLKEVGAIKGVVKLEGQSDHTGIDVYIPGTSFLAKTDEHGSFMLGIVPEGTWNIRADSDGYTSALELGVAVVSKETTTMKAMELNVFNGVEGSFLINNGQKISPKGTVSILIEGADDAINYMMSENINFKGEAWATIPKRTSYTFEGDGAHTLYMRFADKNGLETTPIDQSITVDTAGPVATLALNNGDLFTGTQAITAQLGGEDLSTIANMMISEKETFEGAEWETFSAQKTVQISSGDGEKIVYFKLMDEWDYESAVVSAKISLDSELPLSPSVVIHAGDYTNTQSITLTLAAESTTAPIAQVFMSEDKTFAGVEAVPFSASLAFSLSTGEGSKTVYAKYVDGAGNMSAIVSDTVTLDTVVPTSPVLANIGKRLSTSTETVSILTESSDINLKSYQAKGGGFKDWVDVNMPILFDLSTNDKFYDLAVRAMDRAGNVSSAKEWRLFRGAKTILSEYLNFSGSYGTEAFIMKESYSPYRLKGGSNGNQVQGNGHVTIEAGVIAYVDEGAMVAFNSGLIISGTSEKPVVFTSNKPSPSPGDWFRFLISSTGSETSIDISHLVLEYFDDGFEIQGSGSLTIRDTTVRNWASGQGLWMGRTGTINLSYLDIDCGITNKTGISTFQSITTSYNISNSIIQNCSTGISIGKRSDVTITNSNFFNNSSNISNSDQNFEKISASNNYWGYNDANGVANSGDYQSKLKISHQGSGTMTWSPYSTVAISGTGPR